MVEIKQVIKALDFISAEDKKVIDRYVLHSIYMDISDKGYFTLVATNGLIMVSVEFTDRAYLELKADLKTFFNVIIPMRKRSGYFFLDDKIKEKIKVRYSSFEIKNFYADEDEKEYKYPDYQAVSNIDFPAKQDYIETNDYPIFSFEAYRKIEKFFKILKFKQIFFKPEYIKNKTTGVITNQYIAPYTFKMLVMPVRT
jgi:hypothetical protein